MQNIIGFTAILATLTGSLGGVILKHRHDLRLEREKRQHEHRLYVAQQFAAFLAKLSNHRAAMWWLEEARAQGRDTAAPYARHLDTRADMTEPHILMQLLMPGLADEVHASVRATYDMDSEMTGREQTMESLVEAQRAAKKAEKDLIDAAIAQFKANGITFAV